MGSVSDVLFWQDKLVVVDAMQKNIKLYDPSSGEWIRTLGRGGEGPSEFLLPMNAAVTPEGQLAVLDKLQTRVSFFDPDGTFDRSWTAAVVAPGGIAVTSSGTVAIAGLMPREGEPSTRAVHLFSEDGEFLESIGIQPAPAHPLEGSFNTLMVEAVGSTIVSLPFTSNLVNYHDLDTGDEWAKPVGENFYRQPIWPERAPEDPVEAMDWANEQMFAFYLGSVDSTHYTVGFGEYEEAHQEWLYRWVITDLRDRPTYEIPPTPAVLGAIRGDRAYSVQIRDDGNTQLVVSDIGDWSR